MNIYVSTTGSDTSGDGSQSNPYRHIQKALDESSDGDVILIMPGTYETEDSISFPSYNNLIIKPSTNKLGDVVITISDSNNLSSGGGGYYLIHGGISNPNPDRKIFKIVFKVLNSSRKVWIYFAGTYSQEFFTECVFIKGNNVTAECAGMKHDGYNGGNHTFRAYKCSFIDLDYGIVHGAYHYSTYDIQDCIFKGCTYGVSIRDGDSWTAENNNCFYDNIHNLYNYDTSTDIDIDSSDITSNPRLYNDYKIMASSPCVDQGITISGYVESYKGNAPDIGAWEADLATISGQVTLNGSPVQGAIIRVFDQTLEEYIAKTTSNASGNYSITVIPNHKYHVFVEYTDSSTGEKFNALSKWNIDPIAL